jgi:hypothetical protein
MPETPPPVLTTKMLAERWAVSEQHVRNLAKRKDGGLQCFRLGGKPQ